MPNSVALVFNANGTVSMTVNSQTVIFGAKFAGAIPITFSDGIPTTLRIGTEAGDALSATAVTFGRGGDDTVTAPATGANLADGGAGTDTLLFSAVGVTADLASGTVGAATIRGIENATGTTGGDRLLGDAGGNLLKGVGGADTLDGREGGDTLLGG